MVHVRNHVASLTMGAVESFGQSAIVAVNILLDRCTCMPNFVVCFGKTDYKLLGNCSFKDSDA